MKCQNFEVPFVAFYRKEYVEQELGINDLWKVYQWDEKVSRILPFPVEIISEINLCFSGVNFKRESGI